MDAVHADHHALEFHPITDYVYNGNDGGVYISEDAGTTWTHFVNLPITQFYNIEVSESDPNFLYGGTQDNNTLMTSTIFFVT